MYCPGAITQLCRRSEAPRTSKGGKIFTVSGILFEKACHEGCNTPAHQYIAIEFSFVN
jgi:hypothetical protein